MSHKSHYTLVEILAAMAIFMIICLVVMRFFSGAQQITVSTKDNNEMYADVRAFFDIFESDLKGIVYNNSVSNSSIYPFAHSYYPFVATTFPYLSNIEKFYDDSSSGVISANLKRDLGISERKYSPLLCFISNQSNLPRTANSPLCEIRYTWTPVGGPADQSIITTRKIESNGTITPDPNNFHGGTILRSCTYADVYKNSSNSTKPDSAPTPGRNHPHDFEVWSIVDHNDNAVTEASSAQRIKSVFKDISSSKYEKVIGRVYRMNISCYKFDATSSSYKKIRMLDVNDPSSSGIDTKEEFNGDASAYLDWPPTPTIYYPDGTTPVPLEQLGHPLPDMIKVEVYMLGKRDWQNLMNLWSTSSFKDINGAKKILDTKLRRFSRNFYIDKVDTGT